MAFFHVCLFLCFWKHLNKLDSLFFFFLLFSIQKLRLHQSYQPHKCSQLIAQWNTSGKFSTSTIPSAFYGFNAEAAADGVTLNHRRHLEQLAALQIPPPSALPRWLAASADSRGRSSLSHRPRRTRQDIRFCDVLPDKILHSPWTLHHCLFVVVLNLKKENESWTKITKVTCVGIPFYFYGLLIFDKTGEEMEKSRKGKNFSTPCWICCMNKSLWQRNGKWINHSAAAWHLQRRLSQVSVH